MGIQDREDDAAPPTGSEKLELGTLPEIIREPDLEKLNLALGFLFSRLRVARAQFEQEGDNGRLGAANALNAFWKFITVFRRPYMETLQVPILRLSGALAMLEESRVEPILQPVRRRGRAPSSDAYASLKGQAAATVQLLLRTDLARSDADWAVAKELCRLGVRPERGSGTVTATTVRHWRDEVSSDVGRRGPAAVMYDRMLAPVELEKFSRMPKNKAKEFALQSLAHWVRSLFPELQKPT